MAVLTMEQIAGGSRHFTWRGADGTPFPGLLWESAAKSATANVLCIHGLSGAAADFGPLARHLAAAGCTVRAVNLRGQGNDPDPGRRGHFLDPAAWREDLAVFATGFEQNAPLFVVGESMGALVAVDAVAHGALRPKRVVLAAPVTQTRAAVPGWVVTLLRAAAGVCPRAKLSPLRFVHGKTALPRLTADDDYMAYLQTIPHRVGGFTIDFLAKFEDLMRGARENAGRITAPTLLLAGGHDVFIRPDQSRSFFDSLGAEEKEFCLYPDSHHLLWHDVDRDDVLARISRWIAEGCR